MLRAMRRLATASALCLFSLATFSLATFSSQVAFAQDGPVLIVPVPSADATASALATAAAPLMDQALQGRSARLETSISATISTCTEPACIGQAVASAGAVAALIVRSLPETQTVQIDLVAAGSGVPITVGVRSDLSGDINADVAQILNAATVRRLAGTIAPPPVRAALLVTTNVRGASINIDGQAAGEAPARAIAIAPGEYTVTVTANGFASFNRRVTVTPEGARVNALLEPTEQNAAALADEDNNNAFTSASADEPITKKWWFWAAVGGGALVVAGVITAIAVAAGGDDGPTIVGVPPIPGGR